MLELCQASVDKLFLEKGKADRYNGLRLPNEEMILQLATGLAYIHSQKLVHRDLKPENALIWVAAANYPVIMKWADFGLSKPVSDTGSFSVSNVKGTTKWLAPEILNEPENRGSSSLSEHDGNNPSNKRRGTLKSDVFAEGITFGYILLGGEHPYGSTNEIVFNLSKNKPVNLRSK